MAAYEVGVNISSLVLFMILQITLNKPCPRASNPNSSCSRTIFQWIMPHQAERGEVWRRPWPCALSEPPKPRPIAPPMVGPGTPSTSLGSSSRIWTMSPVTTTVTPTSALCQPRCSLVPPMASQWTPMVHSFCGIVGTPGSTGTTTVRSVRVNWCSSPRASGRNPDRSACRPE